MKQYGEYTMVKFPRAEHTVHGVKDGTTICGKSAADAVTLLQDDGDPKKRTDGELLAYDFVCLKCKVVLLAAVQDRPVKKNKPGRPRVAPKARYTVKISPETLKTAKAKHPDIHAKVVGFIKQLSEDDL